MPASAAAPSGSVSARARAVAEPLAVALQHEDVREEVVAEDDGLGALQMRVARQRRVDRLGGARDERLLHAAQAGADARDDLAEIEPLVDRDLVVAGAAGVELAADLADQLLQPPLDIRCGCPRARAGTGRCPPRARRGRPRARARSRRAPRRTGARPWRGPCAHATLPGDVVRPEPPVERQGPGEPLGGGIGALVNRPPQSFGSRAARAAARLRGRDFTAAAPRCRP